jgi:hypothetical protein
MSYICEHPAFGASANAQIDDLLQQREVILYAAVLAAAEDLRTRHPRLSDALSYAAIEYIDTVNYVVSKPSQPNERGKVVRHD